MKLYKFSNGTEAELFRDKRCWHCDRDKAVWSYWDEAKQQYIKEPEWGKGCRILARALGCETYDPKYPTELRWRVDGPACTAFVNRDDPSIPQGA